MFGYHFDTCNGRYRWQGLAPEAERPDRDQVGRLIDLRSGKPLESSCQLTGGYALAVIDDRDRPGTAADDMDIHPCRARVEGVFNKLLHH